MQQWAQTVLYSLIEKIALKTNYMNVVYSAEHKRTLALRWKVEHLCSVII